MLRGVAYGFYLLFSIKALAEICGLKNVTCAVFVVAIFNAVIQALTLMLFGRWITDIGYAKFYFITFVIVLIGNVINFIYAIYHKFDYRSQKNL